VTSAADSDEAKDSDSEAESASPNPAPRPWPTVEPQAIQGKQFMTATDMPGGQLAVTARDGEVQSNGAPSGLFSQLVSHIGDTIRQMGNLATPPLVVGAHAGKSITIVFGEPLPDDAQIGMPYHAVWRSAETVARLISLDEEQIFDFAIDIGLGATAYADLARVVESEGLTLDWEVKGIPTQRLTADLAARQYQRLSKPAELRERSMTIDGLLYGATYEGKGHGRARMRLSKGSAQPPRRQGRTVIVEYESQEIEDQIIHNLIGEPVIATIRVKEPAPRTSVLRPEPPFAIVDSIERGGNYNMQELFSAEDDDAS